MVIDFDDDVQGRRPRFQEVIPKDVKLRVFVIGPKNEPETIKRSLGKSFMEIGKSLAADCDGDTWENWHHEQLRHNDSERLQLVQTVRPFLFRCPGRR